MTDPDSNSNSDAWQPTAAGSAWLLWLGLIVTILWVALGLAYIFGSLGWSVFSNLSPD